jgi:hypothetical protein
MNKNFKALRKVVNNANAKYIYFIEFSCILHAYIHVMPPRVVTREKNSSTVAHARRKRRLKWVLGAWEYNWVTQSPGDINMETWSSRLGVGAQG